MNLRPLALAINQVSGGFSPSTLFSSAEQGMWYDLNDDATIFQDSAGTTLASWGDPVGLVLDKHEGLAQGANVTASLDLSAAGWFSAGTVSSITASSFAVTGAGGRANNDILLPNTLYYLEVSYTKTGTNTLSIRTESSGADVVASSAASGTLIAYGFTGATDQLYFRLSATGTVIITSCVVRSIAGNHAIQSTSGSRPIRGRMPKSGRRNLTKSSENISDATNYGKTRTTTPDANTLVETADTGSHIISCPSISITAGAKMYVSFWLEKGSLANAPDWMQIATAATGFVANDNYRINFNLTTLTVGATGSAVSEASVVSDSGYIRIRAAITAASTTGAAQALLVFTNNTDGSRAPSYAGSILADVKVRRVQVELGGFTDYQHVIDSLGFNVTESGQPSCGYLSFNGSNQWMQTAAAVDLSGTSQVSVFVGARKIVDTPSGAVLAAATSTTNGRITVFIPTAVNANSITNSVRSSTGNDVSVGVAGTMPVLTNKVVTLNADLSAPLVSQRVDGAEVSTSTSALGGTFANITLYFGATGGTTNYFNGLMFSIIIRGALTSGTLLTRTEQYVARQTPTVNL